MLRDRAAVREVHKKAFGDEGEVAALTDALRATPARLAPLSFVAMIDGTADGTGDGIADGIADGAADGSVVGNVMLIASRLDAPLRIVDVYVLSPLGVLPEYQGRGIGTALIGYALEAARERRVPLVFLEGEPGYYGTRGFERADALGFRAPSLRIPPPAFQVARLPGYEPWMTGTLVYHEAFWAHDAVGLREAPS